VAGSDPPGDSLEDLELRRQDEAYLNLLGAARIPDPTTAGDFCRRFQQDDLQRLQEAYDVARRKVCPCSRSNVQATSLPCVALAGGIGL
jgi:hypothetical protein